MGFIIPLPMKQRMLPEAPGAVLDTERRPEADLSPQMRGIAEVARLRQPQLRPEVLSGKYAGLDAVGRAVMQAGGVVQALAMKRQEAKTDLQVAKAAAMIERAMAEAEAERVKNPDPSTWVASGEKKLAGVIEGLKADSTFTPQANQQVGVMFARLSARFLGDTQLAADKELFRQAQGVYLARMTRASTAGNVEETRRIGAEGVDKGYLFPAHMERLVLGAEEQKAKLADKAQFAGEERLARIAPFKYLELYPAGAELSPAERFGRETARALIREGIAEAVRKVEDGMAIGEANPQAEGAVSTPGDLDRLVRGNLFLANSPKAVGDLKVYLAKRDRAREEQDREENGRENYFRLAPLVKAYEVESDPKGEQFYELWSSIRREVPAEHAGYLREILWARRGARPAAGASDVVQGFLNARVREIYDPVTGKIPWRFQKSAANVQGEWEEDAGRREKAMEAEWRLQTEIARELKERARKPQTMEEAKEILEKARVRAANGAMIEGMSKRMAPAGEQAAGRAPMSSANRAALRESPSRGQEDEAEGAENEAGVLPALGALTR